MLLIGLIYLRVLVIPEGIYIMLEASVLVGQLLAFARG
jgi:hypothetical protein